MEARKFKQFHVRIKYATYRRLRHNFPAEKKESAVKYFERLARSFEK